MKLLSGSDLGVPRNDNYMVVESENPRVVFSYAQKGHAITLHFACEKKDLRHVRQAVDDCCKWLFSSYDWCKMIFGFINRPSIERMVQKIEFKKVVSIDEGSVYIRLRGEDDGPAKDVQTMADARVTI